MLKTLKKKCADCVRLKAQKLGPHCPSCFWKLEKQKRARAVERIKAHKKKSKERKKISFPFLKRELDRVFSIFIRQRDGKCFTCNAILPIAKLQNGHYVPRQHLSLRWSELNCSAQCMPCNVFKKGAMDEYATNLLRKYGPNILEKLLEQKRKTVKFTTTDLQTMIEKYKAKLSPC